LTQQHQDETNGSRFSDPDEVTRHKTVTTKTHNDDRKQGSHYALEKKDAH
jgi:hypothetical protein